jgi:excinuclease UvrABC nuclease subunit
MSIRGQWWSFVESMVQIDRDEPGVYELGDVTGTVVYIGSSHEVRKRLLEHLSEAESACVRRNATQYRIEYTHERENRERELYRLQVATYSKPPRCNDSRRASGD